MTSTRNPCESAIDNHTYKIFPNDLNPYGTVFGGVIMSICDRIALVVAERHSEKTCVTAAIDSVRFLRPAGTGDILLFSARINRSWRTSMEIGVRVEAENYKTHFRRHILSAYFTFVAVDETQKPSEVPQVVPQTMDEKDSYRNAEHRRQNRLTEQKTHDAC